MYVMYGLARGSGMGREGRWMDRQTLGESCMLTCLPAWPTDLLIIRMFREKERREGGERERFWS